MEQDADRITNQEFKTLTDKLISEAKFRGLSDIEICLEFAEQIRLLTCRVSISLSEKK